VFGLYPQTVQAALAQVDPKSRGPSLLDNPGFKVVRAGLPKDAQSLGYVNTRYLARLMYPLLRAVQTMGSSMLAGPAPAFEVPLLPTVDEYLKTIGDYVGTTSADADGVLYAGTGSGAPLLLVPATAALTTSVMLPSLARAREMAKRAVSAANLRAIGMAAHMYADEKAGKFPASLDELSKDGPGSLNEQSLRSPRDPNPVGSSYVYIAGQTSESDARNVLAYERLVDKEGTNVLFVDGHVEWMKQPAFARAVRETYRRLDRAADLPANIRALPADESGAPEDEEQGRE
jgi:prepilin-type processing-associated H-X9-DG protein